MWSARDGYLSGTKETRTRRRKEEGSIEILRDASLYRNKIDDAVSVRHKTAGQTVMVSGSDDSYAVVFAALTYAVSKLTASACVRIHVAP